MIACLFVAAVAAYNSPLILVSGAEPLPILHSTNQYDMQSVEPNVLLPAVEQCNYDAYIFVSQASATPRDINPETMPFLTSIASWDLHSLVLPAVFGAHKYGAVAEDHVVQTCGAQPFRRRARSTLPVVLNLDLNGTSFGEDDVLLSEMVGELPSSNYLLVYRTIEGAGHAVTLKSENATLFDNYVFFSPAVYMGGIITFLIGFVLVLSLGWLRSLTVSYSAFDKK